MKVTREEHLDDQGTGKKIAPMNHRHFSNATWQELEDIWPANIRVMNEAYKVMSVFMPAMTSVKARYKELFNGVKLNNEDLFLLFWIHRVEDLKENVGVAAIWVDMPMNWSMTMWQLKQSRLNRAKLIENIPLPEVRLYRVTPLGKQFMRDIFDAVEQAHRDIKYLAADQPEGGAQKVNRVLKKYFKVGRMIFKDPITGRVQYDEPPVSNELLDSYLDTDEIISP